MKSLAHPEWPYVGTPWEWRGFAEKQLEGYRSLTIQLTEEDCRALLAYDGDEGCGAVYQKQNFGPELK